MPLFHVIFYFYSHSNITSLPLLVVNQNGCYFHYAQSLFRKVQKLGLTKLYKEGTDFSVLFDMLKSLVYVPVEDLRKAFDAIITLCARNPDGTSKFENGSPVNGFINYYVNVSFLMKLIE